MKKKNSVTLLITALSTIGVFLTGYFTAKEAPKVQEKLKEAKNRKEKAKIIVKGYAKSLIAGGATIAGMWSSQVINMKQIAFLGASGAAIGAKYLETRKAVREKVGEEVLEEIDSESAVKLDPNSILDIGMETEVFVDGFAGNIMFATKETVEKGLAQAKLFYEDTGYLTWCDIPIFIEEALKEGNERAKAWYYPSFAYYSDLGEMVGWSAEMGRQFEDEDYSFDYELVTKEVEGKEVTIIKYKRMPEYGFFEY